MLLIDVPDFVALRKELIKMGPWQENMKNRTRTQSEIVTVVNINVMVSSVVAHCAFVDRHVC